VGYIDKALISKVFRPTDSPSHPLRAIVTGMGMKRWPHAPGTCRAVLL